MPKLELNPEETTGCIQSATAKRASYVPDQACLGAPTSRGVVSVYLADAAHDYSGRPR